MAPALRLGPIDDNDVTLEPMLDAVVESELSHPSASSGCALRGLRRPRLLDHRDFGIRWPHSDQ
jgi:hypothetical protein